MGRHRYFSYFVHVNFKHLFLYKYFKHLFLITAFLPACSCLVYIVWILVMIKVNLTCENIYFCFNIILNTHILTSILNYNTSIFVGHSRWSCQYFLQISWLLVCFVIFVISNGILLSIFCEYVKLCVTLS